MKLVVSRGGAPGIEAGLSSSGGRGLGFNMARALAEGGLRGIAIMHVQRKVGEEAARRLSDQTGVGFRFYQVDVRDGSALNQAASDIVDHYGQINVLLNSSGSSGALEYAGEPLLKIESGEGE